MPLKCILPICIPKFYNNIRSHHAVGGNLNKKKPYKQKIIVSSIKTKNASAGNRTRGPTMATLDFTTKPPMLGLL